MPHAYTEDQLVEQPAIQLLGEMGWETVSALEELPGLDGTLGRETTADARRQKPDARGNGALCTGVWPPASGLCGCLASLVFRALYRDACDSSTPALTRLRSE